MYSIKEHDLRLQLLYKLKSKNESLKKSIERSKISRQILERQLNTCFELAKRKIYLSEKLQNDMHNENKKYEDLHKLNKKIIMYQQFYEEQIKISELLQGSRREFRPAIIKNSIRYDSDDNNISNIKAKIDDTKDQIKQFQEMFLNIESEHDLAENEYKQLLSENTTLSKKAKIAAQIPQEVSEIENVKIPELISKCKGLDELIAENSTLRSKLQRMEKNIANTSSSDTPNQVSSFEAESIQNEIAELREKLEKIDNGFVVIQEQAARVRQQCMEVMRSRNDMDSRAAILPLFRL